MSGQFKRFVDALTTYFINPSGNMDYMDKKEKEGKSKKSQKEERQEEGKETRTRRRKDTHKI